MESTSSLYKRLKSSKSILFIQQVRWLPITTGQAMVMGHQKLAILSRLERLNIEWAPREISYDELGRGLVNLYPLIPSCRDVSIYNGANVALETIPNNSFTQSNSKWAPKQLLSSLPIPPSFESLVQSSANSDRPPLKWCGQVLSSCSRCQLKCYPIICDPGIYPCLADPTYNTITSSTAAARVAPTQALKQKTSLCLGLCHMCVNDKELVASFVRCNNCYRYFHNNNHSSSEDVLRECDDNYLCKGESKEWMCFHCIDTKCGRCHSTVCTECEIHQCALCEIPLCHSEDCYVTWCKQCSTDGHWCTNCFQSLHLHANEDNDDDEE
jgi:hypothetical protein